MLACLFALGCVLLCRRYKLFHRFASHLRGHSRNAVATVAALCKADRRVRMLAKQSMTKRKHRFLHSRVFPVLIGCAKHVRRRPLASQRAIAKVPPGSFLNIPMWNAVLRKKRQKQKQRCRKVSSLQRDRSMTSKMRRCLHSCAFPALIVGTERVRRRPLAFQRAIQRMPPGSFLYIPVWSAVHRKMRKRQRKKCRKNRMNSSCLKLEATSTYPMFRGGGGSSLLQGLKDLVAQQSPQEAGEPSA